MAFNLTALTKDWIQFLKNNQIVSMQSDPKTGRLKYKRQPSVDEFIQFLKLQDIFDPEDINAAVREVLSAKGGAPSEPPAELSGPEKEKPPETPALAAPGPGSNVAPLEPGERPEHRAPIAPPDKPKKYSNDDAEDIEYRDVADRKALPPGKKPRYKYKAPGKYDRLAEAFYDRSQHGLSEDDIKKIFKILLTPKAAPEKEQPAEKPEPSEEEIKAQKQEYMRQLKELVRETMTPAQRKALWRALSEENISEAIINRADVGAIFKDAAYLRSKPTGMGRFLPKYRKKTVTIDDLQKAWAEGSEPDGSDGYSNDTNDIKRILQKFGFGDAEIKKVFGQVFNADKSEYDDVQSAPAGSKTVQKIADLAKSKGLDKALKAFLEQEFGEELGLGKKATYEDVRNIFTAIVNEERTDRMRLIREEEKLQLGRSKK